MVLFNLETVCLKAILFSWLAIPLCSECPAAKPDKCNCGVCGSYGECKYSCNPESDEYKQNELDKGFIQCRKGNVQHKVDFHLQA